MKQQASMKNEYMAQVMQQQADVELNLRKKKRAPAAALITPQANLPGEVVGGADSDSETPAVEVRITGWFHWKRVIVPPNAHVVHTRLGEEEPLTCGLGVSFRFNPYTDSFLVVPATIQTILINANCICRERQGILVQGYVQWFIGDFATAYKKLDFSDPAEPMRVVNVQLREQAEATIKDTVATMSIDDVLADKQPIVEELTTRLRTLAEGDGKGAGLGLRIITVQIKEAVVSSARLWESLQRPFRAERTKDARLAELEHEGEVLRREAQAEQERARLELEAKEEIARLRDAANATTFSREQGERARRAELEAETLNKAQEHERAKLEVEAGLRRMALEKELELEDQRAAAQRRRRQEELEHLAAQRKVENDLSPELLQERLIAAMPLIAERLPKASEHKSVTIGGVDGLTPLVQELARVVEGFRRKDA